MGAAGAALGWAAAPGDAPGVTSSVGSILGSRVDAVGSVEGLGAIGAIAPVGAAVGGVELAGAGVGVAAACCAKAV